MKTGFTFRHITITLTPDGSGSVSLDREELTECFGYLIGATARSVPDSDIDAAFDKAFMEYKRT